MPYAAPSLPESPELFPNRIRWTKSQCHAMREAGILTDRYELIDGEIINKMGQNPPHAYVVRVLIAWLTQLFGALQVQCQLPIAVAGADPDHNDPEPDAAVTIGSAADFATRHPGPTDLLLVAEVADTTLRSDRVAKAVLYARAGIREYWIVDIVGRQLLVHRQPGANGYEEVTLYNEGEMAATLVQSGVSILVADLLPPIA